MGSFTFFDIDQKPKRELTSLFPPCAPLILADASSSPPTHVYTHAPQWWGSSRWHPHQGPCGGDSAMTCGPHPRGRCGGHHSHETSLKSWLDPMFTQPRTRLNGQRRDAAGSHFALLLCGGQQSFEPKTKHTHKKTKKPNKQ